MNLEQLTKAFCAIRQDCFSNPGYPRSLTSGEHGSTWRKFTQACTGLQGDRVPLLGRFHQGKNNFLEFLDKNKNTLVKQTNSKGGWVTSLNHQIQQMTEVLKLISLIKSGQEDQFVQRSFNLVFGVLYSQQSTDEWGKREWNSVSWKKKLLKRQDLLSTLGQAMNDPLSQKILRMFRGRYAPTAEDYAPCRTPLRPPSVNSIINKPSDQERDKQALDIALLQARPTLPPTTPKEMKLLQELANLAPTDQAVIRVNTILQAKILAARFQTAGVQATWWAKAKKSSAQNLDEFCSKKKKIIFVTSTPDLQDHQVKLVVNWSPQINESDEDSVASIPWGPGGIYAVLAYKSNNGDIDESWKLSQT
jgi:hypothetical protein